MRSRRYFRLTGIVIGIFMICLNSVQAQLFTKNVHRFDPYKKYKFRVKWDGKYVPGIISISGLHRNIEVVTYREGGENGVVHKLPGKVKYEPIILKRGRTHDPCFEDWANKTFFVAHGLGQQVSPRDFRKDIIIELLNEAGQKVMAFVVRRCWPSRYSAIDELDSTSKEIALEILVLENEGWERDRAVTEPKEPIMPLQ